MKQKLEGSISEIVKRLFGIDLLVELTRPDEQFGDFATNVAMQLAGRLGKNPREVAEAISAELRVSDLVTAVTVAGPGFINLTMSDSALAEQTAGGIWQSRASKRVLLEYSCPNAFKELHTGHLYQTIAGDALGRLLEASGATIYRANFGGDVGLHVAKCLYGAIEKLGGEYPGMLYEVPIDERPGWLSAAYVAGAQAYENDPHAKTRIAEINASVYAFHTMNDHESDLAQIYWECRDWSYAYFINFYLQIDAKAFNAFYPESQTTEQGLELVRSHPEVFVASDGAVVYQGEDSGLHTRVFITSQGLPTYETKDIGVITKEYADFPFDQRIIMTGNDQSEYMKVVFAALGAIDAELAAKQTHLTNGTIRFGSGQKMSSRLGNVTRAVDVIDVVGAAVQADNERTKHDITLGAIKYSFLKHRLGGDIAFDVNESVSLEGNSGPYLQYAHARARSILKKASDEPHDIGEQPHRHAAKTLTGAELEAGERSLLRKLSEFPEAVDRAVDELLPHLVCGYLYELSQTFNSFYEHNRVIGHEREAIRLALVVAYAATLQQGLNLLGIAAPDQI